MKSTLNGQVGFGLLETVIAVGILSMVVGASLALSSLVSRQSVTDQHRLVLNMLAQEGIERVKNTYETNGIDERIDTEWAYGLRSISGPGATPMGFKKVVFTSPAGDRYRWGFLGFWENFNINNSTYWRLYQFSPTSADSLTVNVWAYSFSAGNIYVRKTATLNNPRI